MPELPEVETVKRVLAPQLVGRRIESVAIGYEKLVEFPGQAGFIAAATGAEIVEMRRRGKFLLLDLAGGSSIACHLRMTGQLLVTPKGWPEARHTHMTCVLDDGSELRFADMRRFGRLWLAPAPEIEAVAGIAKLGPEPFSPVLTGVYLEERLGKRRIAVKQALLDQGLVAGIGNIYADEILHRAGIRPEVRTADISAEKWAHLARLIPEVLGEAIEQKGMTAEAYLNTEGREYRTEDFLRVYGRTGQGCPACGAEIQRVTVGGRGSHFCPACQK